MRLSRSLLTSLVLAFLTLCPALADPSPPAAFTAQDRWAVLGDSITHYGSYHTWVMLYYVTRFPDQHIDYDNCGISGDTAAGALERVNWDVLSHHPTVVSVMLGMNDVRRTLYSDKPSTPENAAAKKERIDAYKKSMADLVDALQASGAKVILIQPSIFDETADLPIPKQTGVNEALGQCSQFLSQLSSDTGASLVDFYDPMNAATKTVQAADPKATIVGKDRIHPGPAGHFLMAYTFLKAQGVTSDVSHVTIDAAQKLVQDSGNSTASDVKIIKGGITFNWEERSLPYPIDPSVAQALAWVPFTQDMNQEVVTVLGLNPGATYQFYEDGALIRTYTAEELARGVNLAIEKATPQYAQALTVYRALQDRAQLVVEKIRSLAQAEHQSAPKIDHPVTVEQMAPLIATRLARLEKEGGAESTKEVLIHYAERKPSEADALAQASALLDQAYALATPKPHSYKIVLVR